MARTFICNVGTHIMIDFVCRLLQIGEHSFERTFGSLRSNQWPAVRDAHLKKEPICQVCGGGSKLNVHHIRPFHTHPELELDPNNLITLCNGSSGTIACHIRFGHLDNFKDKWNPDIRTEAPVWNKRFLMKTMPVESAVASPIIEA